MAKKNAAAAPKAISVSARAVFVTCLVPNGLQMRLQEAVKVQVPKQGGGYEMVEEWRSKPGAPVYRLRGPAVPVGPVKGYKMPDVEDGFAITPNIPVEFWAEWLEQNKLASYVTEGMVVAHDTHEDAVAWCRENYKLRSGLEPLSTDEDKDGNLTDPRMPRPLSPFLSGIQEDDKPSVW